MTIDHPKACHIPQLKKLWQEAFGDTDVFLDGFFDTGFSPDRCCGLWEETLLVSVLYWFDCTWQNQKVAYLYAVATGKQFQGRGFCRQLMEKVHNLLKERGYVGAILVPGNQGLFTLYEKMGYAPCCLTDTKTISAGKVSLPVQKISATEYARLQKMHLPQDAVIHGPEALAFADTFCGFYQGDDFAFCGGAEDDKFYFQEFLGDTCTLPGVLAALKAAEGQLRLPGKNPFAMYLSFTDSNALPSYFDIPLN